MHGIMLICRPQSADLETHTLSAPPDLAALQGAVGGYIEAIPGFEWIEHSGVWRRCVAFCNETGKLDAMPLNSQATRLWDAALKRRSPGSGGLRGPSGELADILVGPIAIIYGDDELMGAL